MPENKELQERIQKFIEAYGALVKEHKIDFASYPTFVPTEKGVFSVVVQTRPVEIQDTSVFDTPNEPAKEA